MFRGFTIAAAGLLLCAGGYARADGDIIRLDANAETLQVLVSDAEWDARPLDTMPEELRAAHSASGTRTNSSPVSASTRMMSPSRTLASGPPAAASGET